MTPSDTIGEEISELPERARDECEALLNSATFSTGRNLHLRGTLTTVSILVRPDTESPADCRIDVLCQAAGQLPVEWERVPLTLIDPETSEELGIGVLGPNGRGTLRVPYGNAGERELQFRDPWVKMPLSAGILAMQAGPAEELPEPATSGRIDVEVKLVPVQTLEVVIHALDESLRYGEVTVEIRSRKSGVLCQAKVPLNFPDPKRGDGMLGVWHAPPQIPGIEQGERLILAVRAG